MRGGCILGVLCLLATPATALAGGGGCVADGAPVTAVGVVRLVHKHDKHTGQPYAYAALAAERAYCISAEDADRSNAVPTRLLTITSKTDGDDKLARRYVGRRVAVQGTLESTDGGGPLIFYSAINPR